MALVYKDRIGETSPTTGTGAYSLEGAVNTAFKTFSDVLSDGDTCYYVAWNDTGGFETGLGTYTASTNTLARTTILESTNGGSAVSWGAGDKYVMLTLPASIWESHVVNARKKQTVSSSSGVVNIDLADGEVVEITMTEDITDFNVTWNLAGSGIQQSMELILIQDGTGGWDITDTWWTTTVKWSGGSDPTPTAAASSRDRFAIFNDGTTIDGMALQNLS